MDIERNDDYRSNYLEAKEEKEILDGRHAIIIVKPSGQEIVAECPALVDKFSLQQVIRSIIDELNLEVIQVGERQINEDQVRVIYPILNKPSEFGEKWKEEVIKHMTSEPLEYYYIAGDNAGEKTQFLKKKIRSKWIDKNNVQSFVVENLLHVADQEDLIKTYKVMILGEK